MSTTVIVSTKGQVVIPAAIREELGLLPGRLVQVIGTGVGVLIKPLAKDPIETGFGKLAGTDLHQAIREGRKLDYELAKRLSL